MATIKDIRLVPRDSENYSGFVRSKMTIALDTTGDPVKVDLAGALEQDVIKSVFTEPQDDGYGSVIFRVIGDKNLQVVKAMLTYTIISALQSLLLLHKRNNQEFLVQFKGQRCLDSLEFIYVEETGFTKVRIQLGYKDKSGADNESQLSIDSGKA